MTITWTEIHNANHQFSDGVVNIDSPFAGNVLAISCDVKPEYQLDQVVIGYLYQYSGVASRGYAIKSGNDIISLEVGESDKLVFIPTPYLNNSYGLSINYTTVGSVISNSNTEGLPALITDLPNRVTNLEAEADSQSTQIAAISATLSTLESPSWDNLTNKPDTFPPSAHNHEISEINGLTTALSNKADVGHQHSITEVIGLTDELSTLYSNYLGLDTRVDALESATPVSSGSSQNFIALYNNQALESNKNYFAATSGLICALPNNPSIGDVINLSTGNYTFRVNHGNSSQFILNSSTNTTVGTDSGIILKPYSAIELIYQGANIWVSGYRTRTINNWTPQTLEATPTQKSYTATGLETYTYYAGSNTPNLLNNGNFSTGVMKTDGGTTNQLQILFTFPEPVILTSFNYWLGQFNGLNNMPQSCDVFIGNTVNVTKLIGSFSFPSSSGTINLTNTQISDTYVINFKSNNQNISVGEIRMFGKGTTGGEISVI